MSFLSSPILPTPVFAGSMPIPTPEFVEYIQQVNYVVVPLSIALILILNFTLMAVFFKVFKISIPIKKLIPYSIFSSIIAGLVYIYAIILFLPSPDSFLYPFVDFESLISALSLYFLLALATIINGFFVISLLIFYFVDRLYVSKILNVDKSMQSKTILITVVITLPIWVQIILFFVTNLYILITPFVGETHRPF